MTKIKKSLPDSCLSQKYFEKESSVCSQFEGRCIRSYQASPEELSAVLQPCFQHLEKDSFQSLVSAICRISKEALQNWDQLELEGVAYTKSSQETRKRGIFSGILSSEKSLGVSSPYSLRVTVKKKKLRVQIILPKKLGSGGYKHAKVSWTVVFSPQKESGEQEIKVIPTVLKRTNKIHSTLLEKNMSEMTYRRENNQIVRGVRQGLWEVWSWFPELNGSVRRHLKKTAPQRVFQLQGKTGKKLEWEEPWMSGDLGRAIREGKLQVSRTNKKKKRVGFRDQILIVRDVLRDLKQIHAAGGIHHDLKASNLFLSYNKKQQRFVGILGDWDGAKGIQKGPSQKYLFWDVASQHGHYLPTSDLVGLTWELLRICFGEKVSWFLEDPKEIFKGDPMPIVGQYQSLLSSVPMKQRVQNLIKELSPYLSHKNVKKTKETLEKLEKSYRIRGTRWWNQVNTAVCKLRRKNIPEELQGNLDTFYFRWLALEHVWKFGSEIIRVSEKVDQILEGDTKIGRRLRDSLFGKKATKETRAKAMKELYEWFPVFQNYEKTLDEVIEVMQLDL